MQWNILKERFSKIFKGICIIFDLVLLIVLITFLIIGGSFSMFFQGVIAFVALIGLQIYLLKNI